MFNLEDVLSKLVQLKRITDGGVGGQSSQPSEAIWVLGQSPQPLGDFL